MLIALFERLLAALLWALLYPLCRLKPLRRVRTIQLHGPLQSTLAYRCERRWPRGHRLWCLNYLDVLRAIACGQLRLTGPSMVWQAQARPAWTRCHRRPGLLSPGGLLRRQGLSLDSAEADLLFCRHPGKRARLTLLLRYALCWLLPRCRQHGNALQIMGTRLDNLTLPQAMLRLRTLLARRQGCQQVAFANADCLNAANLDADYRAILQRLPLVLPDGIGVKLAAAWFARQRLRCNLNGTDLFPHLLALAEAEGWSVFLLGGQAGVAADCSQWVRRHYPRLRIAGHCHGFESDPAILHSLATCQPDVLLVGMGAPRQEKWIACYQSQLPCRLAMGVGGLFDYYSGRIPRAPVWMREMGLEWVFRLYQEPGRLWRRYLLGNLRFLWQAAQRRAHH